jgi:hypothetical protein
MTTDVLTTVVLLAFGAAMLWSQLVFKRWLDAYRVVWRRRRGAP